VQADGLDAVSFRPIFCRTTTPTIASIVDATASCSTAEHRIAEGELASGWSSMKRFRPQGQVIPRQETADRTRKEGVYDLWKQKLVPLTKLTELERAAVRLEGESAQLIAQTAQTAGRSGTELQIHPDRPRSEHDSPRRPRDRRQDRQFVNARSPPNQLKRVEIRRPRTGMVFSPMCNGRRVITRRPIMMVSRPDT